MPREVLVIVGVALLGAGRAHTAPRHIRTHTVLSDIWIKSDLAHVWWISMLGREVEGIMTGVGVVLVLLWGHVLMGDLEALELGREEVTGCVLLVYDALTVFRLVGCDGRVEGIFNLFLRARESAL